MFFHDDENAMIEADKEFMVKKIKLTRKIVPVFVKPCQVAGLNMSNAPRSEDDFIFPIKDTFLRIRKGNKCLYKFVHRSQRLVPTPSVFASVRRVGT